jgi:hypothetical protein
MMELVAGIVVAGAVMALVLEPLVRARPLAVSAGNPDEGFDFTDIEESASPKIQALLAIKEIEFDRETGKLSDEDYRSLKATYQRAALAAIKVDEGKKAVGTPSSLWCTMCGEAVPVGAKFCGECGAEVGRY